MKQAKKDFMLSSVMKRASQHIFFWVRSDMKDKDAMTTRKTYAITF